VANAAITVAALPERRIHSAVIDRRYSSVMTIDNLANHRSSIPKLARYFFDEWRPVYQKRGMTLDDVTASFEARANLESMPLALVAIDGGQVIGTGSLKLDDLEVRPQLSPWLGGLFVVPEHRNRGVATALIQHLLHEARRLHLAVLYLWTPASESLYSKLGWNTIERLNYCGYSISLTRLVL
jgi:GNAT superfamily N-acetyltransferase